MSVLIPGKNFIPEFGFIPMWPEDHDRSEWLRCKRWIEDALPYALGTHTIEDVEEGIATGNLQFWAGRCAAVVTEILNYPRLKALNFFLVGGDLRELTDEMEPRLTRWAVQEHGCSRVSIVMGRRGWSKVLEKFGYTTCLNVGVKELHHV